MKKILVILSLAFLLFACERNLRDYAGVKKQESSENYETDVRRDALPVELASNGGLADGQSAGLDGEALYKANCSACHQVSGQGVPGVFPPLDKSPYVLSDNTERMASIMVYGLGGQINVLGSTYNGAMAPLGHLKNDELAAIMSYVRSAWSNKAGSVDEALFQSVRDKNGARGMFAISDLGEEK